MSKKKTHKCDHCDFKAKTQGGLKTHVRAKHTVSERHSHFDLNIKSEEQAAELVGHMTNLKQNMGWALLKQILEGNIAVLEQMIIDKIDSDGKEMSEDDVDKARARRSIMKEMIMKPDQLINTFKKQAGIQMPDYDPYATDVRQFARPEYGTDMASPLQ